MASQQPGHVRQMQQEEVGLGFGTLLQRARQRWWVCLLAILATVSAAIFYLHVASYRYTAELTVGPAQNEGGRSGGMGALRELGALGGISLPVSQGAIPMMQFIETLQSRETAEVLAKDQRFMRRLFRSQWDEASGQWKEPRTLFRSLSGAILSFIGAPRQPWAPPAAAQVQEFLEKRLKIEENPKTPFVVIRYSDTDPEFAILVLDRTTQITNASLRRRALARADENIRYLSAQLQTVMLAEHREALAQALGQQERQRMFASSSAPFAAEPLGQTTVSSRPTSPAPLQVMVLAIVIGAVLAFLVLLAPSFRKS
jgi:uncharacterized protein involved in exopolysaccharide biosynthesis